MDYFKNHGKNTPKDDTVKKNHLWIDTETLCNNKKEGGFGCINIKDFFSGLKLSWIRRYALNKINDHWCDIIDTLCGIENINDRQKILSWGSEYFTEAIKNLTQESQIS